MRFDIIIYIMKHRCPGYMTLRMLRFKIKEYYPKHLRNDKVLIEFFFVFPRTVDYAFHFRLTSKFQNSHVFHSHDSLLGFAGDSNPNSHNIVFYVFLSN